MTRFINVSQVIALYGAAPLIVSRSLGVDNPPTFAIQTSKVYTASISATSSGRLSRSKIARADDPDCRVLHCLGGTCYNSPLNETGWSHFGLADVYEAGDYEVSIQ